MRELLGNLRFSLDDFGGMRNLAVGNVRGFQLTGALGAEAPNQCHNSALLAVVSRRKSCCKGNLGF
jgi:hypothetical protein